MRRLTRRTFLATTAAGSAVAATMPRALADTAKAGELLKGSGQLTVSTWGGAYVGAQKAVFFEPFTKATGIRVITTGTPDAAKLKIMQDTKNVEWDLLDAEGQMMYTAQKAGYLEPMDYDLVFKVTPKSDFIPETIEQYGFPSVSFGWVLAWSTKTFPTNPPQNWADFWDVNKFKGRRAVYANPRPLLEIALLADGVPRNKIYPIDVDRAFKKLDQIKKHIAVWVEDTGQYDVLLQNGEVDMMLGSLGRSFRAKQNKLPVDYTFNDGLWQQSYWVIPKNAPNAKNAMKLIAWMGQADLQAAFVAQFPYGMNNLKSYPMMKPEIVANVPTSPANLPKQVMIDPKWWTDNLAAVNRRWLEWYASR